MHLRDHNTLFILSLAVAVGCAGTSYTYAPEEASVSASGRLVTRVGVPPEEPRGEITVESRGLTKLRAQPANRDIRVVHLRLTVSNDSDNAPWVVDAREQLIEIPGEGKSRAIVVNTDRDGLPIVRIARREQRVFDLYYPLPASKQDEDDLAGFDLLWQVQTGTRVVAQRTTFERVEDEPDVAYSAAVHTGWGPYWWYDPFYPRHAFLRPVIIHQPTRITVRRPRGFYRPGRG